jgi:integrase
MTGDMIRRFRESRMTDSENGNAKPIIDAEAAVAEFQRRIKQGVKQARQSIRIVELSEERDDLMVDAQRRVNAAKAASAADVARIQAAHIAEAERQQSGHASTIATMVIHHAQAVAEIVTSAPAPVPAPAPVKLRSMLLSEAIEYALKIGRAEGWKNTGVRKKWTEKTADEYSAYLKRILLILGDKPIAEIGFEDADFFISKVRQLPKNIGAPRYEGKTVDEIIAMGEEPMSQSTVKKHVVRASSLFNVLTDKRRQGKTGATENPFAGESGKAPTTDNAPPVEVQPFDSGELTTLLSHPSFLNREFTNPYCYWMIPLALFTGARQNELAQLHLSDIVEHDGIKCIDINDEGEGGRVKTENGKRLVPLHDELIRLGLLDYVETLRAAGYKRLFPELSNRRDGYGQAVSNWFQRHRAKCGITEKRIKVFHSFRHTVISELLNAQPPIPVEHVAPIVGHEMGIVNTTTKVYWNKKNAAARKSTIDRLIYPDEVLALLPTIHEVRLDVYGHGRFWNCGKIVSVRKIGDD